MSLSSFIGYFALIDLLFLPNFFYIAIPYSLLPVFGYTLWRLDYGQKDVKIYIALSFLVLLATTFSFYHSPDFASDNVKRALQLILGSSYYFLFRYYFNPSPVAVKRIFLVFAVYMFALVALFVFNHDAYNSFRATFYPSREEASIEEADVFLRFLYNSSDPNTSGCLALIPLIFFLKYQEAGAAVKWLFMATVALLGVISQSKTLWGALAVVLLLSFYKKAAVFLKHRTIKKSEVRPLAVKIFLVVAVVGYVVYAAVENYAEEAGNLSYLLAYRVSGESNQLSVGGRWLKYEDLLQHYLTLPIGYGYTLKLFGAVGNTHNDHLRFIFGYGFIVYFATLYLWFRKIFDVKYIFLVVAFAQFTFNTLIDETRLLGVFLICLALTDRKVLGHYDEDDPGRFASERVAAL
jgi:hypothetical protein